MKKEKKVRITDRSAKGVDRLLKEIRKLDLLTKEEEYELWQKMKEGDMTARDKLIKANMRYVVKKAKDFIGSKAALEDLIMAGTEGMVKAARLTSSRRLPLMSWRTSSTTMPLQALMHTAPFF